MQSELQHLHKLLTAGIQIPVSSPTQHPFNTMSEAVAEQNRQYIATLDCDEVCMLTVVSFKFRLWDMYVVLIPSFAFDDRW